MQICIEIIKTEYTDNLIIFVNFIYMCFKTVFINYNLNIVIYDDNKNMLNYMHYSIL